MEHIVKQVTVAKTSSFSFIFQWFKLFLSWLQCCIFSFRHSFNIAVANFVIAVAGSIEYHCY